MYFLLYTGSDPAVTPSWAAPPGAPPPAPPPPPPLPGQGPPMPAAAIGEPLPQSRRHLSKVHPGRHQHSRPTVHLFVCGTSAWVTELRSGDGGGDRYFWWWVCAASV